MRSTFFGIEVARRALNAQRVALDVTAHNIANANTPGYSRQVARMQTTTPIYAPAFNRPVGPGQFGTGVHVTEIRRMRNRFVENRLRQEQQSLGRWQERLEVLRQVELMVNEPSDYGIRHSLDMLWRGFQELSKHPDDMAVRATVRERAKMVADAFSHTYRQLQGLQQDTNSAILVNLDKLNTLSSRVAELNNQIAQVKAFGDAPNDLLDERDKLIRQMSELADVSVSEREQGMVSVSVGGYTLVDRDRSYELVAIDEDGNPITDVETTKLIDHIEWGDTGNTVNIDNGMISGQWEMLKQDLPDMMEHLDTMAAALIDRVNEVHRGGHCLDGSQGHDFFEPYTGDEPALNMALADDILGDDGLRHIAASANGVDGNGDNALELARIKGDAILNGETATVSEYLKSVVASLGVATQEAETMTKNQQLIMDHLNGQVASISGVSLDEEMANMIKFQHAYSAAARMMTTVDEVLNVLINRTGRVGL